MDLFPRSDDGTLKADSAFLKWANFLHEASVKFGRPYVEIAQIRDLMAKVGFEDVTMSVYKWPSNSWPKDTKYKELGIWNNENVLSGLEAFSMAPFTRALDWKPAEVSVFLIDVRKDVNDRSIHAYWPMSVLRLFHNDCVLTDLGIALLAASRKPLLHLLLLEPKDDGSRVHQLWHMRRLSSPLLLGLYITTRDAPYTSYVNMLVNRKPTCSLRSGGTATKPVASSGKDTAILITPIVQHVIREI